MVIFKDYFILLYALSICAIVSCNKNQSTDVMNSCFECEKIDSLIDLAKSDQVSTHAKIKNLDKAYKLSNFLLADSLKINYLFQISNQFYKLKDYSKFRDISTDFLELAIYNDDSVRIADYYWNMGAYFSAIEVLDSAYYNFGKARFVFKNLDHQYYTAKMEYNMAYVLRRSKNYIESETFAFRSITNLNSLNKKLLLYRCYNHLGLLYNDLDQFELSIKYHLKSMNLIKELPKKGIYFERSLNNLSLVYQKQKEYDKAIAAIDEALSNKNLALKHSNLYAKLIDNRTYNRFLKGEVEGLTSAFNKALRIRDSLGNEAGIGISNLHLSEFNLSQGDSSSATAQALNANKIAVKLGLNRDILNSLSLLSKADPIHASIYMDEYMKLNDSLLLKERKVRDKFARIQFETAGYIAANKDLKQKNVWLSLTSLLAFLSVSLFFFAYRQKSKNKTLMLEQQQQKSNEEIYDLMLKQQNKEEEGRIQERIRISEDLHDGALARLFSVRISLGFLKVKGKKDKQQRFNVLMKELQSVEKEVRDLSHALKDDELSAKKDFPKLLSRLMEEQSAIGKFAYSFKQDTSIAWDQVDERIKINLFRIVQEAVCNILKYAKCQRVVLSIKRQKQLVEIFIVDDGIGFDTNKKSKGIGIKNMKSRAKSIDAKIDISSGIKQGTRIKVNIPTKIFYDEPKT